MYPQVDNEFVIVSETESITKSLLRLTLETNKIGVSAYDELEAQNDKLRGAHSELQEIHDGRKTQQSGLTA